MQLPARQPDAPSDLAQLLADVPELRRLAVDGTERPVRRPKDPPRQKEDHRGKKKSHRQKNLLITSERRVAYLGPTCPGSRHDKRLADESGLSFPPDALPVKDTGFQGGEPPGSQTLQPKKKPRGRELPPIQQTINRVVSRARLTVEHALAGVKRCRIVADTFRHGRAGLADAVMEAARGLHNLRVAARA